MINQVFGCALSKQALTISLNINSNDNRTFVERDGRSKSVNLSVKSGFVLLLVCMAFSIRWCIFPA
jgi:hypothetical protein